VNLLNVSFPNIYFITPSIAPIITGIIMRLIFYIIYISLHNFWGFQEVDASSFQNDQHMKVARLSTLRIGRRYPPRIIPGTHFRVNPKAIVRREILCQWKNSSDTTGNRTRDISACGTVPQPTAPLRTPFYYYYYYCYCQRWW
jgi:hypothetical protein